ncbi:hypothetical protein D3C71_77960 [compost metagenome]
MNLTDTYLKGVSDTLPLIDQGELAVALVGLAEAANHYIRKRTDGKELTEVSTGSELRESLNSLRLADRIRVLDIFQSALKEMSTTRPSPLEFTDLSRPPRPPASPVAPTDLPVCVPSNVAPPGFMEVLLGDGKKKPELPPPPEYVPKTLAEQQELEDRRLRRWLVKTGFWFVVVFTSMVLGAVIAIAVRSGQMPDGVVVNSVLTMASEVLKLIFSNSYH